MHFYFVTCMHLLNIIVYLYASSTTCAQQLFHVHSSQTDKLINIICVYMPMIRYCGRFWAYHVILGDGGSQEDASRISLACACAKYGHVISYASRKIKLKVEVNKTIN